TSFTQEILPPRYEVVAGDRRIRGALAGSYASVDTGELLALIGSAGLLEISVRDGSAAAMLGLDRDAPLIVRPFAPWLTSGATPGARPPPPRTPPSTPR